MQRFIIFIALLLSGYCCLAQQPSRAIKLTIVNEAQQLLAGANVKILKSDSSLIKAGVSDREGLVEFLNISGGQYIAQVSYIGYQSEYTNIYLTQHTEIATKIITLKANAGELSGVVVTTKKPLIEFLPDKTVINPEAGITNAGTSIMDVLEKSPGITIGKDGNISMKGKPQVMVLIDGKQTQLNGAELQAYLSGMNASQVEVIELIENPGAKYDAAGNSGIINIKTKKNRQKGFNGSLSLSYGQGFYSKINNSFNINYRAGKLNLYLNYGMRGGRGDRMKMDVLRKYFNTNGNDSLLLQQPNITATKNQFTQCKSRIGFFLLQLKQHWGLPLQVI